jgi:hypothetical protein
VFGDSELALRASSVLMSALACGVVAAGVAQQTRVLASGAIAGLMLAIDPHSLFFGTELRVFPAILLIAACTCWAWSVNRRSVSTRSAIAVVGLILLAALVQPTSIAVLGCLAIWPIAMFFTPDGITRPKLFWLWGVALTCVALVIAWQLAGEVLMTAWKHRGQWAALGSARNFRQIETLWRWKTMAIIPASLAIVAVVIDRFRSREIVGVRPAHSIRISDWARPMALVLVATAVFWTLSIHWHCHRFSSPVHDRCVADIGMGWRNCYRTVPRNDRELDRCSPLASSHTGCDFIFPDCNCDHHSHGQSNAQFDKHDLAGRRVARGRSSSARERILRTKNRVAQSRTYRRRAVLASGDATKNPILSLSAQRPVLRSKR